MKKTLSEDSEMSADTAVVHQLVSPHCTAVVKMRKTAYEDMNITEFIQTVLTQQSLNDQVRTVQRRLTIS